MLTIVRKRNNLYWLKDENKKHYLAEYDEETNLYRGVMPVDKGKLGALQDACSPYSESAIRKRWAKIHHRRNIVPPAEQKELHCCWCNWRWKQRYEDRPKVCPRCNVQHWDKRRPHGKHKKFEKKLKRGAKYPATFK